MSTLHQRLVARIAADGPMPVSAFMAACLLDPADGYYTTANPFGAQGDFITAPEISQMFGELIGLWALNAWQQRGQPTPFVLAEAGPGRGTLMADMLRATAAHPAFHAALQVVLIEASPQLRQTQRAALSDYADKVQWADAIDALPPRFTIFIANEFLDALPLRQAVKTEQGWRERCIGLNDKGALAFVAGATSIDTSMLPSGQEQADIGTVFEYAPAREAVAATLAGHLKTHGGFGLMIDYGHTKSAFGDTLQAMRQHAFASVLENPGKADITSHVDFDAVASAARAAGAHCFAPSTQGEFLLALGIEHRAGTLGRGKDEATRDMLRASVQRLAGNRPQDMGDLFKVLCLADEPTPLFPFQ
ncbi:MAG: class I SAM-dependent methyltransferase [Ahrensia sp.]